jgi:hypothetical protein
VADGAGCALYLSAARVFRAALGSWLADSAHLRRVAAAFVAPGRRSRDRRRWPLSARSPIVICRNALSSNGGFDA